MPGPSISRSVKSIATPHKGAVWNFKWSIARIDKALYLARRGISAEGIARALSRPDIRCTAAEIEAICADAGVSLALVGE